LNRKSKRIGGAPSADLHAERPDDGGGVWPDPVRRAPGRQSGGEARERVARSDDARGEIGQLSQLFLFGPSKQVDDALAKGQLGSLLFVTDPARINSLQRIAVEKSRLHIPLIFGFDVIHGFRTIFPVPIAMAASWDPSMVSAAQAIAAKESEFGWQSTGRLLPWSTLRATRVGDGLWRAPARTPGSDPPWPPPRCAGSGRIYRLAGHVLACMKHFAGYGAAEGGRTMTHPISPRRCSGMSTCGLSTRLSRPASARP